MSTPFTQVSNSLNGHQWVDQFVQWISWSLTILVLILVNYGSRRITVSVILLVFNTTSLLLRLKGLIVEEEFRNLQCKGHTLTSTVIFPILFTTHLGLKGHSSFKKEYYTYLWRRPFSTYTPSSFTWPERRRRFLCYLSPNTHICLWRTQLLGWWDVLSILKELNFSVYGE